MNKDTKILVVGDDNSKDIYRKEATKLQSTPPELYVTQPTREYMFESNGFTGDSIFMNPVMNPGHRMIDNSKKDTHKCLLPSCNKETNHNGGYCCAEHFKQHKEELKKHLDK